MITAALTYGQPVHASWNPSLRGLYIGEYTTPNGVIWIKVARDLSEHAIKNCFEIQRKECMQS